MLLNVPYKRQNGLDDRPNHDKENVPPSFGSQKLTTKQQIINISNPINIKSTQAMEEAMDAVKKGTTSLRKASTHWNIPLSMSNHLYGKKIPKSRTNMCINSRRKSSGGFLGFDYVGC
jgi:hypothetical protein